MTKGDTLTWQSPYLFSDVLNSAFAILSSVITIITHFPESVVYFEPLFHRTRRSWKKPPRRSRETCTGKESGSIKRTGNHGTIVSNFQGHVNYSKVLERERVRLLHNFHAESVSKGEGSFGNRRPISSCIIHIPLEEGAKLRFQKRLVDRLPIIDNHRRPIVSSLASTPSSGFFYFSGKFKRTRNVDDRKNVKYYWERSTWIMKRHIASYCLNPRWFEYEPVSFEYCIPGQSLTPLNYPIRLSILYRISTSIWKLSGIRDFIQFIQSTSNREPSSEWRMKLLHGIVREVDGCVAGPPTSVSSCIVVTPLLSKSCNDNRQSIISQNSLFKSWPSGKQGGVDPSIIDIIVPRSRYIDELSRNRNPINDTLGRRERWIVLSLSCFVTTWSPAKKAGTCFLSTQRWSKEFESFSDGKNRWAALSFRPPTFCICWRVASFQKEKEMEEMMMIWCFFGFCLSSFSPFRPFFFRHAPCHWQPIGSILTLHSAPRAKSHTKCSPPKSFRWNTAKKRLK